MPKMEARLLLSVLLAALSLKANAYPIYQGYIPNGAMVPNPCNRSITWPGVGHQNVYGSGVRNPFGLAFAANDHVWNSTLCQKDSDGDGLTNGQELGDPNCTWTRGSNSTISPAQSHPGVCEPLDSQLCLEKNSWLTSCTGMPGNFKCPVTTAAGVQSFTLRFPVTTVPAQETTYICRQFALPNDTVTDIVAIEPVIDNAPILHHMLIFACNDKPTDSPPDQSYECGMGGGLTCRALIGAWTVGLAGVCLNTELGFRIGPGGFQYGILQLHWNNPEVKTNLTDSSGLRFYTTTQLRPNRGQVAIVGQKDIEIPPGQAEVAVTGNCSSACTRKLPRSIFLTNAFLHMHTLGRSGYIRLTRNGDLVQVLDNVTNYDYNTPTVVEFATPIEVKPGDDIEVKCVYQSTGRTATTYYGEATSDEMCFGFFAYYPLLPDLGFCGQWKTVSVCNDRNDTAFEYCDFSTFTKLVAVVPYLCLENCTSTACGLIIGGMQATGCQNYPDISAYISAFYTTYGAVYTKCAAEIAASHSPGHRESFYVCFMLALLAYVVCE